MKNEKYVSMTLHTQDHQTRVVDGGSNKQKTYRSLLSQIKHNKRLEEMDSNYLVRPERTKDNLHYEIKNLEEQLLQWQREMEQDYQEYYKRKMPKNVKPFINGLITFTDTMQEDISKYGEKEMFQAIVEFIQEEFGGKIISLDLHLDETTPHFHFQIMNYDFKEHKTHSRIMEQRLRDKENPYRQNIAQDNLANFLQNRFEGFDYKRGKISGIKKYHDKRKAQHEHLEKQKEKIKEMEAQIKELKEQNKELSDENEELKEYKNELEDIIEDNEEMLEEHIEIINEIIEELYEIKEEEESLNFLRKAMRYIRNENIPKFEKLIEKTKRKVKAIKKKSSSGISM